MASSGAFVKSSLNRQFLLQLFDSLEISMLLILFLNVVILSILVVFAFSYGHLITRSSLRFVWIFITIHIRSQCAWFYSRWICSFSVELFAEFLWKWYLMLPCSTRIYIWFTYINEAWTSLMRMEVWAHHWLRRMWRSLCLWFSSWRNLLLLLKFWFCKESVE